MNIFKKVYKLERTQLLNCSIDKAWLFFSSPQNLEKITPSYMNFKITSDLGDGKVYPGQIITYSVRPVARVPIKWATEITHVEDQKYFVDEQRFGPYSMWHHQHWFIDNGDGTVLMKDTVLYAIPLGFIGRLMNSLFIKKQLQEIFDYRTECVDRIFNS